MIPGLESILTSDFYNNLQKFMISIPIPAKNGIITSLEMLCFRDWNWFRNQIFIRAMILILILISAKYGITTSLVATYFVVISPNTQSEPTLLPTHSLGDSLCTNLATFSLLTAKLVTWMQFSRRLRGFSLLDMIMKYTLWSPLVHYVLLIIFDMFPRPLGW